MVHQGRPKPPDCLAVDVRSDGIEYRIVRIKQEFPTTPVKYRKGADYIAEFLALVEGLKLQSDDIPVYSDSVIAKIWLDRQETTRHEKLSREIHALVDEAEGWLRQDARGERKAEKWHRKWLNAVWGENPADIGTKKESDHKAAKHDDPRMKEKPLSGFLATDGSCSGRYSEMQYRVVRVDEVFRGKISEDPTTPLAPISMFLGVVEGLKWRKQHGLDIPIFYGNNNSLTKRWNKYGESEPNRHLIEAAASWIKDNLDDCKIPQKWLARWGETPADF
ncbi:hypothetical protein FACS189487_01360 [Campylobacterota bacterium]|nr:hypothetical protein FACS189487_01360 [Campylobacterota bacterium]